MAPVYFDELNMVENMHQHYQALGGYTYTFADYFYAGITEFLDSEAVRESLKIMDVITFKGCYDNFYFVFLFPQNVNLTIINPFIFHKLHNIKKTDMQNSRRII